MERFDRLADRDARGLVHPRTQPCGDQVRAAFAGLTETQPIALRMKNSRSVSIASA